MLTRDVAATFVLTGVVCLVGACGAPPSAGQPPTEQPLEQASVETDRVALHIEGMT